MLNEICTTSFTCEAPGHLRGLRLHCLDVISSIVDGSFGHLCLERSNQSFGISGPLGEVGNFFVVSFAVDHVILLDFQANFPEILFIKRTSFNIEPMLLHVVLSPYVFTILRCSERGSILTEVDKTAWLGESCEKVFASYSGNGQLSHELQLSLKLSFYLAKCNVLQGGSLGQVGHSKGGDEKRESAHWKFF